MVAPVHSSAHLWSKILKFASSSACDELTLPVLILQLIFVAHKIVHFSDMMANTSPKQPSDPQKGIIKGHYVDP